MSDYGCVLQNDVDNGFYSGSTMGLKKKPRKAVSVRRSIFCLLMLSVVVSTVAGALEEDDFPRRIKVQPVFFVPKGQLPPNRTQQLNLHKHARICQMRYKQMLSGRDTFEIAGHPRTVQYNSTLATLKKVDRKLFGNHLLPILFDEFKVNRYNCPYVFLIIIMNPKEDWPTGGGRPINPGFNSGGGFVVLSSQKLDDVTSSFQATVQHELGHAFGLPHVDTYGYDQKTNKSIMAYNRTNHWKHFKPPKEQGILIPEEIRALSMNKRVFPDLYFDRANDVPKGYRIGNMVRLAFDDTIPGQKSYKIKLSTNSGEEAETKAGNLVHIWVKGNHKAKKGIGLVANSMWMSGRKDDGWIDLDIEFPIAVRMNRISVQSQCGGGYHPIKAVRVEANTGDYVELAGKQGPITDEEDITFKETKARQWRLHFLPGESKQIVLRGLRFYSSKGEFFCHVFPTHLISKKK